ncbi:MAG: hypothetical protein IPG50_35795 [Myxococcales bacterium]|nr:hypothetical protein [Myxococcales bacterium]
MTAAAAAREARPRDEHLGGDVSIVGEDANAFGFEASFAEAVGQGLEGARLLVVGLGGVGGAPKGDRRNAQRESQGNGAHPFV